MRGKGISAATLRVVSERAKRRVRSEECIVAVSCDCGAKVSQKMLS